MTVFEKAQKIVQQQKDVYDAGYEEGFEAGKQAEYDAFWDAVQMNGERVIYNFAFAGNMWTQETFKPKYPIRPKTAPNCFAYWGIGGYKLGEIDLRNIEIDFSNATSCSNAFTANSCVTAVGIINISSATACSNFFSGCSVLEFVEKFILSNNGNQDISGSFSSNYKLKHIIFEGTLGKNGLDMKECSLLSKESIISIVNALSTVTTGLSITLSITAVNNAFEGGSTGSEWLALAGTKNNWTMNLV